MYKYIDTIELRILSLLVQGYLPKQIAPMLNLAVSTVKWRLRLIKAKLGAETTLQAAAIAVARKLVSLDD